MPQRRRALAAIVSSVRARRASARDRNTPTDRSFATACGHRRPAYRHRRRLSSVRRPTTLQTRPIRSLAENAGRVALPSLPPVQTTRTDASTPKTCFLVLPAWQNHFVFPHRLSSVQTAALRSHPSTTPTPKRLPTALRFQVCFQMFRNF